MKRNEVFEGKTLKAEDIKGKHPIVTIESVSIKSFDDNTSKPMIKFKNAEKQLVCNVTNWNAIVEITGEDDSDNWAGKRVRLIVAKVDYQGRRVDGIRVEDPNAEHKPAPVSREPGEDEIPF